MGKRWYIWSAKAHYADALNCKDEIYFGNDDGEMCIRWHKFNDGGKDHPRLECFDDAWKALASF
jgi:hypothetical protein